MGVVGEARRVHFGTFGEELFAMKCIVGIFEVFDVV